jgi:hypothetical protein
MLANGAIAGRIPEHLALMARGGSPEQSACSVGRKVGIGQLRSQSEAAIVNIAVEVSPEEAGPVGRCSNEEVRGPNMKVSSGLLMALVALSGPPLANAQLVAVNGGALVNDPTDGLTWLQDANLFATQAAANDDGQQCQCWVSERRSY